MKIYVSVSNAFEILGIATLFNDTFPNSITASTINDLGHVKGLIFNLNDKTITTHETDDTSTVGYGIRLSCATMKVDKIVEAIRSMVEIHEKRSSFKIDDIVVFKYRKPMEFNPELNRVVLLKDFDKTYIRGLDIADGFKYKIFLRANIIGVISVLKPSASNKS